MHSEVFAARAMDEASIGMCFFSLPGGQLHGGGGGGGHGGGGEGEQGGGGGGGTLTPA